MVVGSSPVAVTEILDFAPASSKEFFDIQATIECGFTLKCVRDMTRTYSQMPYTVYHAYMRDQQCWASLPGYTFCFISFSVT